MQDVGDGLFLSCFLMELLLFSASFCLWSSFLVVVLVSLLAGVDARFELLRRAAVLLFFRVGVVMFGVCMAMVKSNSYIKKQDKGNPSPTSCIVPSKRVFLGNAKGALVQRPLLYH